MSSPEHGAERSAARINADTVARTTFPTTRRGFDPDQVRAFLERVAGELREAREVERELRSQLKSSEARVPDLAELDEARLTTVLGEETARVLSVARESSAEIKTKASETAAALLRDAEEHALAVRTDADAEVKARREEADAEVERIRAEGRAALETIEAESARARDDARAETEQIRADAEAAADAELESAVARGREMVDEALLVRNRVLEDLARKRKAVRVQIERLQAGRERLIESYAIVQRTLDDATDELRGSLAAAKLSADVAARRAEGEPLPSPSQMEREVDEARAAGLTLVPDLEPDVPSFVNSGETEVVAIEVVGEVDDGEADTEVDVDELFARIRASREAEVARAHEVLTADAGTDTDTAADADPRPELEIVVERPPEPDFEPEIEAESEPQTEEEPHPAGAATANGSSATPDDMALLERRDAVTDAVDKQAVRKLKRVLADEQNEVLDRLRRKPKSSLADLYPTDDEHAERYASAVRALLTDVAKSGGGFYGDEPAATDPDDLAVELGQALTLPLRDRVETSLRDAAGDEEAAADGIRAVYRDWKTHRVASQSRDTVFAAFNRGLFESTAAQTELRWIVDNGGSPCPDAEDNSLAGLVVRGEPFPTGHCYPPAHPGCRCLLTPARH